MKEEQFLKDFINFIQEQGFIWGPSPEIYGGLAGFYTYGPLGKLLKNKVENNVRRIFQINNLWELEGPIIMPDIVWKASGHLDTFSDRVIICSKCKSHFRADKLIEENYDTSADAFSDQQLLNFISEKRMKCPSCKSDFTYEIKKESLMMKTKVAGQDASLRPETATVTYLPFNRTYAFFRKKLPFGLFQIGKAFRNEISPRQHVLRSREFTQAEGQIFIDPTQKGNWEQFNKIKKDKLPLWTYQSQKEDKKPKLISVEEALNKKYFKTKVYAWCVWLAFTQFKDMGIPLEKIRLRQHHPDERAFYADDAWDIEILLKSFGWIECCGVHDRTDYDLTQHEKFSKENLTAVRENGEKFKPHILEIAFGTDRPTFALLDIFYDKKEINEGKTMFKLPYKLAPIDIAIFPLIKKSELIEKAEKIKQDLEKTLVVYYDESGSIGKRYLRASTTGIPYCITIDFDSLTDKMVTIRDRDSEKQIRVEDHKLKEVLLKLQNNELDFEKAGKLIE